MVFENDKEILMALANASNFTLNCSKAKLGERIVLVVSEGRPKTFVREE